MFPSRCVRLAQTPAGVPGGGDLFKEEANELETVETVLQARAGWYTQLKLGVNEKLQDVDFCFFIGVAVGPIECSRPCRHAAEEIKRGGCAAPLQTGHP